MAYEIAEAGGRLERVSTDNRSEFRTEVFDQGLAPA